MAAIFSQLGIDWKLLLAQGVNFLVVFGVLYLFVWKPLLRVMHERKRRIEQGLLDAQKARQELANIEVMKEHRLADADKEAAYRIQEAEKKASLRSAGILEAGEKKLKERAREAEAVLAQQREEQFDALAREARMIITAVVAKVASQHPEKVDEALIGEAVRMLEKEARV